LRLFIFSMLDIRLSNIRLRSSLIVAPSLSLKGIAGISFCCRRSTSRILLSSIAITTREYY